MSAIERLQRRRASTHRGCTVTDCMENHYKMGYCVSHFREHVAGDAVPDKACTTLVEAASQDNISELERLIGEGADVNAVIGGYSPLYMAIARDAPLCAKRLLADEDIDPNQMSSGMAPIHVAVTQGKTHCMRMLLEHEDIDVNLEDQSGERAIHRAASLGKVKEVELLLAHPEISLKCDRQGVTLEKHASASGNNDLLAIVKQAMQGN